MRYFYDFEFLEDGWAIEPISVGIASEDGREYYAVFADMPVVRIRTHEWLMANVWPWLPLLASGELDTANPVVKPRPVIASEVREFLLADSEQGRELWAYYGAYDHVALCQLFGTMMQLPKGMPMFTHELMQVWEQAGRPLTPPEVVDEHHALSDARWNLEFFQLCQQQLKEATYAQHPRTEACFHCATDEELARGVQRADEGKPWDGRTIHMQLPASACPHVAQHS